MLFLLIYAFFGFAGICTVVTWYLTSEHYKQKIENLMKKDLESVSKKGR